MSIFAFNSLLAAVIAAFLGIYVLYASPRSALNWLFFLFCSVGTYASFAEFQLRLVESATMAQFWLKASSFGVCFSIPLEVHFMLVFTERKKLLSHWWVYFLLYASALMFALFQMTGVIALRPVEVYWGWTYDATWENIAEVLFRAWSAASILFAIYLCLRYYLKATERMKRRQALYLLIGFSLAAVLSFATEFSSSHEIPELTAFGFVFESTFVWYAIRRYGLFSLTPAIYEEEELLGQPAEMIFTEEERSKFTETYLGQILTAGSLNGPTNPYIAGNPITGSEMFFGRQDVFRFVRETLVGRYQDNAIVLYGGRRTGKTSVLYQMGRHLDPKYVPVFVDLQAVSLGGLGEMLWGIARQSVRVLHRQKGIKLSIPSRKEFAKNPEDCFYERFLDPALEALGDGHLLLMLDEAARLYEQVQAGRLEPRAFNFLRSLIQYHPHLNFIFSIGSGLEEMRHEYALLFNLCQYRKISFLDRDAAVALITKPVEEHYRYAPGAVKRILGATYGQPYYTQLVCNRLFARWARRGGDEVTPADVDAVLGEAVEQGMASLQYAWEGASDAAKVVLAALTELMKDDNRFVSLSGLGNALAAEEIVLSRGAIGKALQELVVREVLRSTGEGYAFTVDLMRLWVKQHQRLEWVKSQVDLPVEVSAPVKRDWGRLIHAGVTVVLSLLVIGLAIGLSYFIKQDRGQTPAYTPEIYGTIAALETQIAMVTDSRVQSTLVADLVEQRTKVAEVATAPPSQEPSITPITVLPPTHTFTPIPTLTPTPSPTPTPTPTPIPTECLPGDGPFVDIWKADQSILGCARDVSRAIEGAAKQEFEGGMMIWLGEADQIIVLYGDSEWALYDGTWKEGDPHIHPDCESMTPPTISLYQPIRGFGELWCTNESVRERLGWATEKEREWTGAIQEFERGLLLLVTFDKTERTIVFYCADEMCTDGKWLQAEY